MSDSEASPSNCSEVKPLVPTMNFIVIFTRLVGQSCIQVPRMAFLRRLPLGVDRIRITSRSGPSGQPLFFSSSE